MRIGVIAIFALLQSTASAQRAQQGKDTYRHLELFARVLAHIQNNYIEPIDERQLLYGAINGMVQTLDSQTQFMPPDVFQKLKAGAAGAYAGLGIEIARRAADIVVLAPIENSPAQRAGIHHGDVILAIDGSSVADMELNHVIQKMRGPAGSKAKLTMMRTGFSAPRELTIIRDYIRSASVEFKRYGAMGHLKVRNFQAGTDEAMHKKLHAQPFKGLVLDLRDNPGGLLDEAVAVSDRFLKRDQPITSTRKRPGMRMTQKRATGSGTLQDLPMVVLVNGASASAAEIVAGALQDNKRAVLLGMLTFGKGSLQTVIEFEDGSALQLTIGRYFTPSGRSIQGNGIVPDYPVPQRKGAQPPQRQEKSCAKTPFKHWGVKDYQLQVALECLSGLLQRQHAIEVQKTTPPHK